ncbi:cupin domain-containing protein [Rahnella sp. RcJ3]|uniref:cupin domain-containing protein n=1 Tax=Rahnella sp. RcJ3 TaxID=2292446 RepID=UPI00351AA64C
MVSQSPEKYAAEPESSGVHAIQLVQSDCAWNGKLYSQYPSGQPCLTVMKMTIEAHTTLPWHTHSMPNAAFIISGQLTVEDRNTGKTRVINAGEAFNECRR